LKKGFKIIRNHLKLLKLMPALNWSAYSIYINAKPLYNNPKSENNILYDFLVCTFRPHILQPPTSHTHTQKGVECIKNVPMCTERSTLVANLFARPFGQGRISENVMHMSRLDGMAKGLLLAV